MDAVLGVSMSPTSVGLVLVEGHDADGATMDRDTFDVYDGPVHTSEQATAAVLRTEAVAATRGVRLHSIGVTWSEDADDLASLLMRALSESGFDNVVPIRLPAATEALARGIADVIGYQTTAVCVIEPDTVIALVVHTGLGAVQTAVNHAIDTDESLISWLSAVFTKADWQPEALVVVGSAGGLEEIISELEAALSVPVLAPAEAELALARGAALASTSNAEMPFAEFAGFAEPTHAGRTTAHRWPRAQTGAIAMLIAGVVAFVVSVSALVSLEMVPGEQSGPVESAGTVVDPPALQPSAPPAVRPPAARTPPAAPVLPAAPPPLPAPAPQAPPAYVEAPAAPAPEVPYVEQAPAVLPPEAVPAPAPPAMAPPAPVVIPQIPTKKPPLRTRILDRLRGIGDPDPPPYTPPVVPAPVPPVQ